MVMSLLATAQDGEVRQPITSGEAGTCPFCDDPMTGHHGPIRVYHWAHQPGAECDTWSDGESEWHLDWKRRAQGPGFKIEQTMEREEWKHRADIVTPNGTVIELQHDYLDAEQIRQRENFYGRVAWIYDGIEWWTSGRLHIGKRLGPGLFGLWFKNGGPSLAMHETPVFIDTGVSTSLTTGFNGNPNLILNIQLNRVEKDDGSKRLLGKARPIGTRDDLLNHPYFHQNERQDQ